MIDAYLSATIDNPFTCVRPAEELHDANSVVSKYIGMLLGLSVVRSNESRNFG